MRVGVFWVRFVSCTAMGSYRTSTRFRICDLACAACVWKDAAAIAVADTSSAAGEHDAEEKKPLLVVLPLIAVALNHEAVMDKMIHNWSKELGGLNRRFWFC